MKYILSLLLIILSSVVASARTFSVKINEFNFSNFGISEEDFNLISNNKKVVIATQDELNNLIDLSIYDNEAFVEAKIDSSIGGG